MKHRHLDLLPDTPAKELPVAALHDVLDRGDLEDWRTLLRAVEVEPEGRVAQSIARLVDSYPMYGTSPLWRAWIERCRQRASGPPSLKETLSLAALRNRLGWTQAQVAEKMGMTQSDYSKLERREDVRLSTLRSLATALGGRLRTLVVLPREEVEIALRGRPDPPPEVPET